MCHEVQAGGVRTLVCNACASPLEITYRRPGFGQTPLHDPDTQLTLGEGQTSLVELPQVAKSLGLGRLSAKLEYTNPTGSFKDRGTAVMVGVMREQGVLELVEDSSGNAGASVAAYCARAGIKAHIFVPAGTPESKLAQIKFYGAELHIVPGSRESATDAAVGFQQEHGFPYASHNLSPYFIEGTKSFAAELSDQFGGELPGDVVMPVGNGSLFIGSWRGFTDLNTQRRLKEIPKIHAVQSVAAMSLVAAYNGEEWTPSGERTLAGGIASVNPPRKMEMLRVLQETRGAANN